MRRHDGRVGHGEEILRAGVREVADVHHNALREQLAHEVAAALGDAATLVEVGPAGVDVVVVPREHAEAEAAVVELLDVASHHGDVLDGEERRRPALCVGRVHLGCAGHERDAVFLRCEIGARLVVELLEARIAAALGRLGHVVEDRVDLRVAVREGGDALEVDEEAVRVQRVARGVHQGERVAVAVEVVHRYPLSGKPAIGDGSFFAVFRAFGTVPQSAVSGRGSGLSRVRRRRVRHHTPRCRP